LSVGGTLRVDGKISANGLSTNLSNSGGGSGGGIYINTSALNGAGIISANGGAGNGLGGGGGGGRIAVLVGSNTFSGLILAYGGTGAMTGGAGTILTSPTSLGSLAQAGALVVDNGGRSGANTLLGADVNVTVDLTVTGQASLLWSMTEFPIRNLLIAPKSRLLVTNPASTIFNIAGNATIQAAGAIIADGMGYPAGQGPGAGRNFQLTGSGGSGGGYGGFGAAGAAGTPGGNAYGILMQPTDRGSGGGTGIGVVNSGGSGGGVLRVNVLGTLQLDGRITANGLAPAGTNSGGGSGGSIWISAGILSGTGLVSANGAAGTAPGGGGGGGGRIAATYGTNTFTGKMSAFGGGGFATGGAGTIYLFGNNQKTIQVIVDNGGGSGTNSSLGTGTQGGFDLTLTGGAVLPLTFSQTIGNLLIASNSWLRVSNLGTSLPNVTVTGNATILAGGGISADGTSVQGQGQGGNGLPLSSGSGGGHGGYGGPGTSVAGGRTYDSVVQPTLPGSGGGGAGYPGILSGGGAGGGAIRVSVTGKLQLDGRVSADGYAATLSNGGGGSGGAIWLSLGGLAGSGVISASGGAGSGLGGGGGGGRIALTWQSNSFTGTIKATGGNGTNIGGAGTIFTKANNQNIGLILADNGGQAGTNTTFSESGFFDLTAQNGALVSPLYNFPTLRNVLIASNAWLVPGSQVQIISVSGNATVQAGGGIKADGLGSAGGQGPGAGQIGFSSIYGFSGGGGGYGGFGSASATGSAGGSPYPGLELSTESPSGVGSGGGGSPASTAGAGGGAVRLNVLTGALQLDGAISASGGAGFSLNGGGGSGGSIALKVQTLSGAGIISANGGAGSELGGGGGGGRIIINYQTNNFTGAVQAYGGAGGGGYGGAGTILDIATNQLAYQITVDNGGEVGADTPLDDVYHFVFDLKIAGGATVYPSASPLVLSNLSVSTSSLFTSGPGQTNLGLVVYSNVTVDTSSAIAVDGKGFNQGSGPGAGFTSGGDGSGAGYGGVGGDSFTVAGGTSYGSATQPVDLGSGGGFGSGPPYIGGSQGGGAIRLNIGGNLTVDGWLSAMGNPGYQDNSGGGSGGSIWITTRTLNGSGYIVADGGEGELYGGGGGAGGRIAIYYLTNPHHTNSFTGQVSAFGADGAEWGDDGTVFLSSVVDTLRVISSTPSGIVTNSVSSINLVFNTALNPLSVSPADVVINTPNGPLAASGVSASAFNLTFGFPTQTTPGNYTFTVGPQIEDFYGRPMAQAYTGSFTISLPVIQGTITDMNGRPVPGVTLQQSAAYSVATTDTNGNYAVGFVPGSTFTVTPVLTNLFFGPASRTYTNPVTSVTNENYVVVSTIAPSLTGGLQNGNMVVSWYGVSGVTDQIYDSTNLVNWLPYGTAIAGTNGVLQIPIPVGTDPAMYFQVQANH
jgi:hypothetical protein